MSENVNTWGGYRDEATGSGMIFMVRSERSYLRGCLRVDTNYMSWSGYLRRNSHKGSNTCRHMSTTIWTWFHTSYCQYYYVYMPGYIHNFSNFFFFISDEHVQFRKYYFDFTGSILCLRKVTLIMAHQVSLAPSFFILKCLCQTKKVSGHVYVR